MAVVEKVYIPDILLTRLSVCVLPCHSINDLFIALRCECAPSDYCLCVLIYRALVLK